MTHDVTALVEGGFDGLIFDCDGTLVDTAPAHLRALQIALAANGQQMTPEWYYPKVGLTPAALLDQYEREVAALAVTRQLLVERYTVAFHESLGAMREVEVIAALAREWKGRVPLAVASNGQKSNVEASLRVTGLLGLFDFVVAAEDVKRGKPEPDVFLEAARRMGVAAKRCVVFEDSDEGLTAARRAGMDGRDIRLVFVPEWAK